MFNEFSIATITSSLPDETIRSAFFLGSDGQSFTVETEDFAFLGKTLTAEIQIDGVDDEKVNLVNDLNVRINFQFNHGP